MTRINKGLLKAKKEAQRAVQYPRVEVKATVAFDNLTYRELQAEAKSRGLKASGSRAVLLERLK